MTTTADDALALAAILAKRRERVHDLSGVHYIPDQECAEAAAALRDLAAAVAERDRLAARVAQLEAERRVLDGETFAGVARVSGGLLRLTIVWDGVSKAPVWFGSGPMLALTDEERAAVKRLRAALGEGGEQ